MQERYLMNKWHILVILVIQNSFLWCAATNSDDAQLSEVARGRDANTMHAAVKSVDVALGDLHNDMLDIKGHIATTAEHSAQLTTIVDRMDTLIATQRQVLAELQKQNSYGEMTAKAQALSALNNLPKETFSGIWGGSTSSSAIAAAIRTTALDLAQLTKR